jgi:hypothetical protein
MKNKQKILAATTALLQDPFVYAWNNTYKPGRMECIVKYVKFDIVNDFFRRIKNPQILFEDILEYCPQNNILLNKNAILFKLMLKNPNISFNINSSRYWLNVYEHLRPFDNSIENKLDIVIYNYIRSAEFRLNTYDHKQYAIIESRVINNFLSKI